MMVIPKIDETGERHLNDRRGEGERFRFISLRTKFIYDVRGLDCSLNCKVEFACVVGWTITAIVYFKALWTGRENNSF